MVGLHFIVATHFWMKNNVYTFMYFYFQYQRNEKNKIIFTNTRTFTLKLIRCYLFLMHFLNVSKKSRFIVKLHFMDAMQLWLKNNIYTFMYFYCQYQRNKENKIIFTNTPTNVLFY
jgi:hypothetical protein